MPPKIVPENYSDFKVYYVNARENYILVEHIIIGIQSAQQLPSLSTCDRFIPCSTLGSVLPMQSQLKFSLSLRRGGLFRFPHVK